MAKQTVICPKCKTKQKYDVDGYLPSGMPAISVIRFTCAKDKGGCGASMMLSIETPNNLLR
jgi:hypothetical protein